MVPLYPTAFYMAPWLVFKPICFQAGISLFCSIFVFPQSVSGQFRGRFNGVLNPLLQAMGEIESLFSDASTMTTFGTPDHTPKHGRHASIVSFDDDSEMDNKIQAWADRSDEIRQVLLKSLAGMQPLNAQQRYLDIDISYGRIPGIDLKELFNVLASVQARASGFSFFFATLVKKVRRTHLDSLGFNAQRSLSMAEVSRPNSRTHSRAGSRVGSAISLKDMRRSSEVCPAPDESCPPTPNSAVFDRGETPRDGYGSTEPGTPDDSDDEHGHGSDREGRRKSRPEHRYHESLAHRLLHSLPHSRPRSRETSPHRDRSHSRERRRKRSKDLNSSIKGSALSLIDHLRKAQQPVGVYESQRYMDLESGEDRDLTKVIQQLELLSAGALPLVKTLRQGLSEAVTWSQTSDRKRHARDRDMAMATAQLRVALAEFKEHRGVVTKPYRHLFDPAHKRDRGHLSRAQHMGLFYCLVASYHLIEFSDALLKFLDMLIEKDVKRQKRRLWIPNPLRLFRQFRASVQREHSDGPDEAQESAAFDHADEHFDGDQLGQVHRRNPDYKPFSSRGMGLLSTLVGIPDVLFSRSAMYALKAGILGCLMSLPAFLASSASFYYYNRGIWCTIMAQMTLAVFAGDTFSSWISRLLASFWGGLIGMIAWYMGSGSGPGNPYGLAVVTAVLFLPMMMFRVHWPGPPLTSIVFCTSVNLVIGYSYLNGHLFKLSNATWGFDVAWLRFVCVVIGITAAWIFSLGKLARRTTPSVCSHQFPRRTRPNGRFGTRTRARSPTWGTFCARSCRPPTIHTAWRT